MPGLDDVLQTLADYRKRFEDRFAKPAEAPRKAKARTHRKPAKKLIETDAFGANPGNLRMLSFVPDLLPPAAPLVVVLHGCTQTAEGYDRGAGWSVLAERFGFAVLFPEQRRANNPNLCFNWFVPQDTTRDEGEVGSIRQMIDRMVADHGLDPSRVGITGLSAGGAMTAAMLACYPESFSHGAIIAGLPYGVASNVQEALGAMFQGADRDAEWWAERVRNASSRHGPWPRVSIWHGTADVTVKPSNAAESVKQWTAVHGVSSMPPVETAGTGFTHRIWRDEDGSALVEAYDIAGMNHGTPIAPHAEQPEQRCGVAGPYMLDVGLSSTFLIAQAWGLADRRVDVPATAAKIALVEPAPRRIEEPAARRRSTPQSPPGRIDPGAVIAKALRAAGLMK